MYRIYIYKIYLYIYRIYIYIYRIYIYIERDLWLHSRSWKGFLPIKCRIWQLPPMKWPYRKVTTLSTHFLVVPSGYESVHLKLSNVGKTKINHPFTHLGMVEIPPIKMVTGGWWVYGIVLPTWKIALFGASKTSLVGDIPTPWKIRTSDWDDDIPNIWTVIKFHGSKAPTRICSILINGYDIMVTIYCLYIIVTICLKPPTSHCRYIVIPIINHY